MNRRAQSVVLVAVGAVALRLGLTDEFARFVNDWMKWPLVVSGAAMVALGFSVVFGRQDDGEDASPVVWVLLLPVAIAFVIQPPALGGYVADRRSNDISAVQYDEASVAALPAGEVSELLVSEFVAYASTYGEEVLADREVRMLGFATRDGDGWYLTRLSISCCAADALAFRVRVQGAEPPEEGQWVELVGTWVEGTGTDLAAGDVPEIAATDARPVQAPKRPYE